jgi:predicted RecA/RadA family phage recombinase
MAVFTLQSDSHVADIRDMYTPSGGVTQGELITNGQVRGFAFATVPASGLTTPQVYNSDAEQQYAWVVKASKVLALKDGGAISAGARVYYDATAAKVTADSTGNVPIGSAHVAAAAGDASLLIEFNGTLEV